jgi:hypothetical protein
MASASAAVERLGHWDPFIEALIPSGGIERGIPADARPVRLAFEWPRGLSVSEMGLLA